MKMPHKTLTSICLCLGLLSASGCAPPAAVEDPAALEERLLKIFDTFTEMEEKGTPAPVLDKFLFWPDAVITGDGVGDASRTHEERVATLVAMAGETGLCTHASYDPILAAGDLAVQFIEATCQPPGGQPAVSFRTLYAWQKRGNDWKVIRELWNTGTLG